MKALHRSSPALLLALLLLACGGGKDEETIRITIEKGGEKVSAEPGVPPTPRYEAGRDRQEERATPPRAESATPPGGEGYAEPRQAMDDGLAFATVAARLDTTVNGRDGAKRNWASLKGRKVAWSGTVHDVDTGRRGFKLYVRSSNPAPSGRYNIVVGGEGQLGAARALRRGQEVRFSGTIHRADYGRRPEEVIVVLSNGRIR